MRMNPVTADRDAEEDLLDLLLDLQTFAKWLILPQSLQIAFTLHSSFSVLKECIGNKLL